MGRQWSLVHALSKYMNVVGVSEAAHPLQRVEAHRIGPSLTLIEGAFGLHRGTPRPRIGRTLLPVDRWRLLNALRRAGYDDWFLWLSVADLGFVPRWLPRDRLVYDCIDPPFGDAPAVRLHYEKERLVLHRAGVVFATAAALEDRLRPLARIVHRLPNGCDDLGPLPVLDQRARPVVGYLGTIDWRFSVAHLAHAAKSLPECRFIVGGRVNIDRAEEVRRELQPLPNVEILGTVSEEDGQGLIESFDVGVIPFKEDEVGNAINPVKMYAYLERGVSVVASDIRECRGREPHVRAGKGPAGFSASIKDTLAARSDSPRTARRAYAIENTWDRRAKFAIEALRDAGVRC